MEKDKNKINKKNNRSAVLKRIALCICILALIGAVFVLIKDFVNEKAHQKQIEELREQVDTGQEDLEAAIQPTEKPSEAPMTEPTPEPTIAPVYNPYTVLFEDNEDLVAWIFIDDTKIDLPVVQTLENETEYLYLGLDGTYDVNGTLLMDTDSEWEVPTTNIIIHGHNMRSGEMFGDLDLYTDQEYAKDHEIISVYYNKVRRDYQVMAVFYSRVYKKTDEVFKFYKFFDASTEAEFLDYYENCKELSLFDTGVEASFGDEFLTLSTCSYQVDNGRFVVVAKMVDQEELLYDTDK